VNLRTVMEFDEIIIGVYLIVQMKFSRNSSGAAATSSPRYLTEVSDDCLQ
jgi:hypothetical protein